MAPLIRYSPFRLLTLLGQNFGSHIAKEASGLRLLIVRSKHGSILTAQIAREDGV